MNTTENGAQKALETAIARDRRELARRFADLRARLARGGARAEVMQRVLGWLGRATRSLLEGRPTTAVLAAVGVGYLAGLILRRR